MGRGELTGSPISFTNGVRDGTGPGVMGFLLDGRGIPVPLLVRVA